MVICMQPFLTAQKKGTRQWRPGAAEQQNSRWVISSDQSGLPPGLSEAFSILRRTSLCERPGGTDSLTKSSWCRCRGLRNRSTNGNPGGQDMLVSKASLPHHFQPGRPITGAASLTDGQPRLQLSGARLTSLKRRDARRLARSLEIAGGHGHRAGWLHLGAHHCGLPRKAASEHEHTTITHFELMG